MPSPASHLPLEIVFVPLCNNLKHLPTQQGVHFTRTFVPKKGARERNGQDIRLSNMWNKSNWSIFSNDHRSLRSSLFSFYPNWLLSPSKFFNRSKDLFLVWVSVNFSVAGKKWKNTRMFQRDQKAARAVQDCTYHLTQPITESRNQQGASRGETRAKYTASCLSL